MFIEQRTFRPGSGWSSPLPRPSSDHALALLFGAPEVLAADRTAEVRAAVGAAPLVSCSTAGEIAGAVVLDGSLVLTLVSFESTHVVARCIDLPTSGDSHAAGRALAAALPGEQSAGPLRHVLVFSDGLGVNGTRLVQGMSEGLPASVGISGGLAGDGPRFERTLVGLDAPPAPGRLVGVGLYGPSLRIGTGSEGGWDEFGPERTVDRSDENVLHTLDGERALDIYRRYLGEHAAGLPSSALLFPLAVRSPAGGPPVTRTVLAVDEAAGTMTFAGDIIQGSKVRLMKANHFRLVEGAGAAAERAALHTDAAKANSLAVLVSCVGRKMVLGQRVEEEVEAVAEVLGAEATLCGFYSYGELAPQGLGACELHNQTMTVTTLSEAL